MPAWAQRFLFTGSLSFSLKGVICAAVLIAGLDGFPCAAKEGQGPAGDKLSAEQIAATIERNLIEHKKISIKWSVRRAMTLKGQVFEQFKRMPPPRLEEFAVLNEKRYAHDQSWDVDLDGNQQTSWYDMIVAFDGSRMRTIQTITKPTMPPQGVSARVEPRLDEYRMYAGRFYLEAIGSPYYSGKHLFWKDLLFKLAKPGRTAADIRKNPKSPQMTLKEMGRGPTEEGESPNFRLTDALKSGNYQVAGAEQTLDGIRCIVLEYPGRDKVWLAPDYGYSLVKREWRWTEQGRSVSCQYANSGFRSIDTGIWLPAQTRTDISAVAGGEGTGHFSFNCELISASSDDVPESLFQPNPPPGTLVDDSSRFVDKNGKAEFLTYVAGTNLQSTQKELDGAIERFKSLSSDRPVHTRMSKLVVINAAVICVIFLVAFLRRKHSSARTGRE